MALKKKGGSERLTYPLEGICDWSKGCLTTLLVGESPSEIGAGRFSQPLELQDILGKKAGNVTK